MDKLRDLGIIVGVYAVYAVVTLLVYGTDRFTEDVLPVWPIIMLGVSMGCMLLWYVLGEWVIRLDSPRAVWHTVWFLLLGVIALVALYVGYRESKAALQTTDLEAHPWLHFAGGLGFYYLASVLASPTFAKFQIWPAKRVRKW